MTRYWSNLCASSNC